MTLRSTSGAGFEFEDLISAWLQVKMLVGEPTTAVGGRGTQIQAQVATLGWRIDDLLLSATQDIGGPRHLAISAKGNLQVSAAGLPADFVKQAWEQWRATEGPMVRGADALALVTRGMHPAFDAAWVEVKAACSGGDPALAISRIQGNRKQSEIFGSVRKAAGTPPDASDEETIALIRHLHVLPVDFQLANSQFESQAIAQCRQLLATGELTEAEQLWKSLVSVATDVRLRRGTMGLADLWAHLRKRHRLRDHPDFASDWKTLADLTADYKARIETELPSGHSVARDDERAQLRAAIEANLITVLLGESGTGKSALCKSVLDETSVRWTQVWLGPDELRIALSASRRGSLPLRHELSLTLNASKNPDNVLVLDSAERIDPADLAIVRNLISSLLPAGSEPENAPWRVVITTQPQSWSDSAETMLRYRQSKPVELGTLKKADVKRALSFSSSLSWLSTHDETLLALANLRTLAWVVAAGPALGSSPSGLASPTAVADRLWEYWTGRAADIQSLTMRLARREASFERSFPLTSLEAADAAIFERRSTSLPLRLNPRTNHVEFEHDLAADWARFQFLKQIASDTVQWGALADNPLWTNALRMLGQFLLRQPVGETTAWDGASKDAEALGLPLAEDILLDALCLDPEAQRLLEERADLLLANDAKRLSRLLQRFRHIATVPAAGALSADPSLGIYFDARFRSIIPSRWPPVLKFLIALKDRLGEVVLPALARLCETWLNGTPRELADGIPMPWRKEMTEIALSIARNVQVDRGRGYTYLGEETAFYTAPLAGVGDLPDEVSAWALEMAGRREISADVSARIAAARRVRAIEHAERLKSDPDFRKRQERLRATSTMVGPSRERLPPWPLGPKRRLDPGFRKACFKDSGLLPLMRSKPTVASEVLLALIVEEEPCREYGSSAYEIELGLEVAEDGYPAIFWKSPFFQFLQIAPSEALTSLVTLVNFCTERWLAETGVGGEAKTPGVMLQMQDGTLKEFSGGFEVFDWTQGISHQSGNLFSALDALERWLVLQLEAGADVTTNVERVLREGKSVALIGLLANVGKFRPSLFAGPLLPILSSPLSYYWDDQRVAQIQYKTGGFQFLHTTEAVLEISKDWQLAPHRRAKLLTVAVDLVKANNTVAEELKRLIPTWKLPDDPKRRLEYRMTFAMLDRANYAIKLEGETNEEVLEIVWPEDLRRDVQAWTEQSQKPLRYLSIPARCEELLRSQKSVSDEDTAHLHSLLAACDDEIDIDPEIKSVCRLALAATLIVNGEASLAKMPEARTRALDIVRAALHQVGETAEAIRSTRVGVRRDQLKFAAYAAMHLWMTADEVDSDWERLVLRLLTSGDVGGESTVVAIAYFYREQLKSSWWRLLFIGLLWSALVLLAPHYDDDENVTALWNRWLGRLRRLPLRRADMTVGDLDVARVAKGYERLKYARQVRAYESGRNRWRGAPARRWNVGVDAHTLGILFSWLLHGQGTGDGNQDRELARLLWEHEAKRAYAGAKDDGEYALPTQGFAYDLLVKLAALSVQSPSELARGVWMPVLSHGPAAHYALRHFARGLFMQLSKDCDLSKFEAVWRSMILYGLDGDWAKAERHWYHEEALLCDLLGFGSEEALKHLPASAAQSMHDVYERWAREHLGRDEESVRRFSHFLMTGFGGQLRMSGLRWVAAELRNGSRASHWYREGTRDALIELLNTAINENANQLASDGAARQALVEIAAVLAGGNNPTALALRERIKLLR